MGAALLSRAACLVEDWADIRRLYRSEKLSKAAIARRLSLSRNTVAKALEADEPPRYERAPLTTSAWAQIEPAVFPLGQAFGEATIASAMIDRIVHHADVFALKGASYRIKHTAIESLTSVEAVVRQTQPRKHPCSVFDRKKLPGFDRNGQSRGRLGLWV